MFLSSEDPVAGNAADATEIIMHLHELLED